MGATTIMNLQYPIEILENQKAILLTAKSQAKAMPTWSKEIEFAYDEKILAIDMAIQLLSGCSI